MPRSYPKEAYNIGGNPNPNNNIQNPNTAFPQNNQTTQPTTQPTAQPNAQFYNPQAFGAAPLANYTTQPTNPPTGNGAQSSVPTQQNTIMNPFNTPQPNNMPPPTNSFAANTGPRHAPPPVVGSSQESTQPDQTTMRGKRPLIQNSNTLAAKSPTLSEYGGQMPYHAQSPAVSRNLPASSAPAPKPEWEPDSAFVSTTLQNWPASTEILDKTGLPFFVNFHPLAETGKEVPVINFTECPIVRCKRCRTYINPYVVFIDGGKRWKCNICYFFNDVPREYFSIVGVEGFRYDHAERVELNTSVVEFVASPEFMHRPPQPPVYFFVIDVSYTAIASGMVKAVCNSILQSIQQKLSKNERTKVGFITVDQSIHFYNLRSDLNSPQMLVVPEIESPFLPYPDDLLVNLNDSMELIEKLLTKLLPELFKDTQETASALGPALKCAYKIMEPHGGKLVVFQSTLPSVGVGKLQNRQSTTTDSTSRQLLQPGEQFYKSLALEFSKYQIGCDLFLFSPKYMDIATLSCLSKYTGGEVNSYRLTTNSSTNDISRLQNDIFRNLTRNTGFEALMRVRCSKGISIDSHHGSFFLRAQDLLTLPNIDCDKSFSLKLKINDPKNYRTSKNLARDGKYYATIQAGLLYTTSNGERRIRVITKCCPITEHITDLYRTVDERACAVSIAKLAVEKAIDEGVPKAVAALKTVCRNIFSKYSLISGPSTAQGNNANMLQLPNTLLNFPLYTIATIKNAIFRAETSIDERVSMMRRFETLSDKDGLLWLHPNLYNLANLTEDIGVAKEPFVMPPTLDLTSEKLDQRGIFLLDDGITFILWVGSAVDPGMLQAVFGIQSLAQVDTSNAQLQIFRHENEYSQRINNIIDRLRSGRSGYTWLIPLKEKDPQERGFFSKLIQDRFPDSYSYREFVVELRNSSTNRK